MGSTLSPTLATHNVPVAAINDIDGYEYWYRSSWGPMVDAATRELRTLAATPSGDGQLDQSRMVTGASFQLVDDLAIAKQTPQPTVAYPSERSNFTESLKDVARLLSTRINGAALPVRAVALRGHGGYDTHSGQNPDFSTNLSITTNAIKAFWADLKARGQDDRVVMMVWSEFGRRPQENGSNGCDHGAAGTAFVIGKRVRQGLIGEFPGLKAFGSTDSGLMRDGNLRATSDYRGVLSALIEQWWDDDAAAIIPGAGNRPGAGAFARPNLIA